MYRSEYLAIPFVNLCDRIACDGVCLCACVKLQSHQILIKYIVKFINIIEYRFANWILSLVIITVCSMCPPSHTEKHAFYNNDGMTFAFVYTRASSLLYSKCTFYVWFVWFFFRFRFGFVDQLACAIRYEWINLHGVCSVFCECSHWFWLWSRAIISMCSIIIVLMDFHFDFQTEVGFMKIIFRNIATYRVRDTAWHGRAELSWAERNTPKVRVGLQNNMQQDERERTVGF